MTHLLIIILTYNYIIQLVEDWNIDAPSYTFTKLDSDDASVREFVNGFLKRDRGDMFEGLAIKDVKIFK